MKKSTLLIALFITITINMNAQWTTITDVNTLIAESVSDDMKAIGTSDGQTYVVFWKAVAAPTNYELRLQLLDASGNREFGDDGMLVSDNIPMSTFTVSWSVAIDVNNNLYVGVTGTGDYSGRAFKLNIGGDQLWGTNGITLNSAFLVTILPLESGEAIVSWIPGNQALMQKYDADGNTVWESPQPVESGSSKTAPGNLFELSNGNYLMVFHTYNYGVNSTLYAQRYDNDGTAQWSSPTQLSNATTAYNAYYSGAQDGDVVYYGYKGSHSNRFDSYLQRINPDGNLPWGINGMDFDVSETNFEMNTRIAFSPGSQYVWSVCNYTNPNQNEYGEYVQKFDKVTGARQFTDNAKMVYAISSDAKVHASDLYLIDDQPFFLLKTGFDNGATPTTLDVLLLDNNGDFAWPEETKPMATYAANKKRIHLTETVNGQAVAVFVEDKSAGLKIYAQNFIDEVSPPAQPTLISPADGATDILLLTTFNWDTAQDAETYSIQVAEDDVFANLVADESGLTDTDFDFTLSDYETTYYWRVMASNSAGDSEWSETWSFTTIMDVPAQPTLVSPMDGATDIPLLTTFNWDTAQDAETYSIQVAEDDAFTNMVADESGLTDTDFDFTLSDYETTYYWRVMASNSTGDSEWSEAWSFTTIMDVPAQPTLVSPIDGATDIPLLTTFNWDTAQDAETYSIQVAEDDAFANMVADENGILITSFDFTLPEYLTTYYWRVMASNTTGNSDWSEIWSFTTVLSIGIEEQISNYELKTYPNPAKSFFNIDFNSSINSKIQLTIYNSTGKMLVISKKNVAIGKNLIEVDIQELPTGTYYYRIMGGELNLSGRFLKIK